jgi:hypothetical protein
VREVERDSGALAVPSSPSRLQAEGGGAKAKHSVALKGATRAQKALADDHPISARGQKSRPGAKDEGPRRNKGRLAGDRRVNEGDRIDGPPSPDEARVDPFGQLNPKHFGAIDAALGRKIEDSRLGGAGGPPRTATQDDQEPEAAQPQPAHHR